MAIKHGTTSITAVKHGSTSLTAVNHGSTSVFPDSPTPTAYTMTFSTGDRLTSWNSTSSATIYTGDLIGYAASGTKATVVTCYEGSTSTVRWTRTATVKFGKVNPRIYRGNDNSDPLPTSSTYDGSYTNLYALYVV